MQIIKTLYIVPDNQSFFCLLFFSKKSRLFAEADNGFRKDFGVLFQTVDGDKLAGGMNFAVLAGEFRAERNSAFNIVNIGAAADGKLSSYIVSEYDENGNKTKESCYDAEGNLIYSK